MTDNDSQKRIASEVIADVTGQVAHVAANDLSALVYSILWEVERSSLIECDHDRIVQITTGLLSLVDGHPETCNCLKIYIEERPEGPRTIVATVNDDMPYLLGSLTSLLQERGHPIHIALHPIVHLSSGRVCSFIHIETEPLSPSQCDRLTQDIDQALDDVRDCVNDQENLLSECRSLQQTLAKSAPGPANFLRWLLNDNFIFLGYSTYDCGGAPLSGANAPRFGLLRDNQRSLFRFGERQVQTPIDITESMQRSDQILVGKCNAVSPVQQREHLDYISIPTTPKESNTTIEHRIIGLFSTKANMMPGDSVPILEEKVLATAEASGFVAGGHDHGEFLRIAGSLPRPELFQSSQEQLMRICLGVLELKHSPRCRAFLREDPHGRFVTALVYVPREQYETRIRIRIESILCKFYQAEVRARYSLLDNGNVGRWHIVLRTDPKHFRSQNEETIDAAIANAALPWQEHLRNVLRMEFGIAKGECLHAQYGNDFSLAYQEKYSPQDALVDIHNLEQLPDSGGIRFHLFRNERDSQRTVRLKAYTNNQLLAVSDCLPILENLGLRVIEQYGYAVILSNEANPINDIYTYTLEHPSMDYTEILALSGAVEETLTNAWLGEIESDILNSLVLEVGLSSRQVVLIRAYTRYLKQLGISYSLDYLRNALIGNPGLTADLIALFESKFAQRGTATIDFCDELKLRIDKAINGIANLDQDRIFRAYLAAIDATVRTNFFQLNEIGENKPYCALKLQPSRIPEAPLPRPFAEIFVYSPDFEGVHLRNGRIARGGLRWSDRQEDYRTEILGLLKAQQVKNAVIVPEGAKGGFVVKAPAAVSQASTGSELVVRCYRTFISALLDITDNRVDDVIVPPSNVRCYDEPDPYLVVAADKGTATFSDIANEVAANYSFWLQDAFASGGSNGYDHKAMGITARGAWVSVQAHFRAVGINVQRDSISVAGIGDMSGDVFGNGMLCSEAIKLVAAFDHRHIFLDPNPDPAIAHGERERLFRLGRTTWNDYNKGLISAGGGVHSRTLKSIALSTQVKQSLGIDTSIEALSPNELVSCILKSTVDLLWFGGIGTYVKSTAESHEDAGDKANNAVRVNGADLRCKVVAEGGNLGCTQNGRIEYAMLGGRINNDALDNSAGVNCSDNEVNIKILLSLMAQEESISELKRNHLIRSMTDDVADLVLKDNYHQVQAISLDEKNSQSRLDSFERLMRYLESRVTLDRELERLPSSEQMESRIAESRGMERPELCVLLAYSKLDVYLSLIDDPLLDDVYFDKYLKAAFPAKLLEHSGESLARHPLKREIIATSVANEIFNRGGIHAVREQTRASVAQIVRAYILTKEIFRLDPVWALIENSDYAISNQVQLQLMTELQRFFRKTSVWFINHGISGENIGADIAHFRSNMNPILRILAKDMNSAHSSNSSLVRILQNDGLDQETMDTIAALSPGRIACDIILLLGETDLSPEQVMQTYIKVGRDSGIDKLCAHIENLTSLDHWSRLSIQCALQELEDLQRGVTGRMIDRSGVGERIPNFSGQCIEAAGLIEEIVGQPGSAVTSVSYGVSQLKRMLG